MPPTSHAPVTNRSGQIMKSEPWDTLTSGYSTKHQTPTDSHEDLTEINSEELKATLLTFLPAVTQDDEISEKSDQSSSTSCIPVVKLNELDAYQEWYNKLINMREQYRRKERGPFPPFPPPPLASSMLAASQASHINTFQKFGNQTIKLTDNGHRFRPSDFKPLPPPHVFLEMIQTLTPHQYIDLTYALAGAVLIELGVRVPDHFPPLPPKIEPFTKLVSAEHTDASEVSSQSSSDGEYSDDSEETKLEKKIRREENQLRRNARRLRINKKKKRVINDGQSEDQLTGMTDKEKQMAIEYEINYKSRTLKKFIRHRRSQLPISFMPPPPPPPLMLYPPPPPPRMHFMHFYSPFLRANDQQPWENEEKIVLKNKE